MLSVYRTLSVRYLGRRWFRALLIILSISLGVATLVATRSLNDTMTKAGLATVNPMAGLADLLVLTGSEDPIDSRIAEKMRSVPGVKHAHPRIFKNVRLADLDDQKVLLLGLDLPGEVEGNPSLGDKDLAKSLRDVAGWGDFRPAIVGKELDAQITAAAAKLKQKLDNLPKDQEPAREDKERLGRLEGMRIPGFGTVNTVRVEKPKQAGDVEKKFEDVRKIHVLDVEGKMAVLAGQVLILDLPTAWKVLGTKENWVTRIDIILKPDANAEHVREDLKKLLTYLNVGAEVRTPEEQNHAVGNVMSGMQTGFALCGLAALGVGLFLVYNSLAVSVAERRHEIGVLLSVGATRRQILLLFTGEAALLGILGSLVGIPLGLGLAYLGLQPAQDILRDIFYNIEASQVELSFELLVLAVGAGTVTAVAAALFPAIEASRENPAEAVRRAAKPATGRRRFIQLMVSLTLIACGVIIAMSRKEMARRWGTYGGLALVMLGSFLLTPILSALAARMLQPVFRRYGGLQMRLAADNMVRSPGRTGLVVAALAAGVALVLQTAGTIASNRTALRQWVHEYIHSDLIVTSGSPVGAGGKTEPMLPELGRSMEKELADTVEAVLPLRFHKVGFRDTDVFVNAVDAGRVFQLDMKRKQAEMARASAQERRRMLHELELYNILATRKNTVIVSENFTALHGLDTGDTLPINTPRNGVLNLTIVGKIADYSWAKGVLILDAGTYLANWDERGIDVFDIYLRSPDGQSPDKLAAKEALYQKWGAANALVVLTREELQVRIDDMIERLYGIAYAQQIVVMFVAALGVVTALLISVLQRRREMGLLRAIGASRVQVIRSVLAEAALMGVLGTLIGVLMGIPLQWYVLNVAILEESGYLFPVLIPWTQTLIIALAAILAATLAGLGPAIHSVRQRIPEAIAYE